MSGKGYYVLPTTALISRRTRFNLGFKELMLITMTSLCLALIFRLLSVSWFVGVPLLLLLSYVSCLKMGILSKEDLGG